MILSCPFCKIPADWQTNIDTFPSLNCVQCGYFNYVFNKNKVVAYHIRQSFIFQVSSSSEEFEELFDCDARIQPTTAFKGTEFGCEQYKNLPGFISFEYPLDTAKSVQIIINRIKKLMIYV